jgi:hypothetical protein
MKGMKMMNLFAPCLGHLFLGKPLESVRIIRQLGLLALVSATLLACNSKDILLHARDGAVDQGAGGASSGGAGGHPGTGGASGLGGSGGTIVSGTGGGGNGGSSPGGSGGIGLGGGGNLGSGGAAKDGGQPDNASDVVVSVDAPVSDDGANCGPGYPVGSQRPQGDGCNTCYCEGGGTWLCTTKQCPPPTEAGAEVSGDAGCPGGQIWCPGCTPGTGSCGVVCTGAPCLAPDAGCDGGACSASDAPTAQKDASGTEMESTTCSQVTTEAECDARGDCHSIYRSIGACGCGGTPGCCMHFLSCADGASATCTPPAAFGCTSATPACDSPYVLSYSTNCYEGCVKPTECSQ